MDERTEETMDELNNIKLLQWIHSLNLLVVGLAIILLGFSLTLTGCGDSEEASYRGTYQQPVSIDWAAELMETKDATFSNANRIEEVAEEVEEIKARSIPSRSKSKSQITAASYKTKGDPDELQQGAVELNQTVESFSQPQVPTPAYSSAPQYSSGPEVQYSSGPEPQYSSAPVKTYSAGPKTYGAPQQTDVRTETRTRRVAKTVYEEVPYQVKVPVMTRPVYQTKIEEYQVPVKVAKTVMKTEQRTRTKMVPVEETYSVNVPTTVMETKYETRTRSKREQIGVEEVAAKPQSFAAAAPTFSAAPVQAAPVQSYQAAPVCSAPEPISYQTERVTPTQCVECQPSYSAAPSKVYSAPSNTYTPPSYASTANTYSAPQTFANPKPKVERSGLFSRVRNPVKSTFSAKPVQAFRSSRGGEGITAPK